MTVEIVYMGRDEVSCANMQRNMERIARRKRILMIRWFVPWRMRKWMPELAKAVCNIAEAEFDRRSQALLRSEWR